jgi:cytochrome bd-type quinol oxidase subunit 2
MSPITRVICGVLGVGGVAAIAFNAVANGGLEADFTFISSLLGGFVFLYIALFGTLPWRDSGEIEEGEMSRSKWQMFWIALVTFMTVATAFLAKKGVFREADVVVLALVGMMFAAVGIALYLYIKNRAEDTNIKW